ncbi:MAG: RluA family pseudouridine synthase [Myxococcota bacterium]|nr:RluA family pseudouridine synthase [Myxococcota bacterium]
MSEAPREFQVSEQDAGRRLDLFLAEKLALSRAQARRLLARGAVRLDGRGLAEAAKGRPVAAGAVVRVAPFEPPGAERVVPEPDAPLAVIARGAGWLAVDKPAGAPVHPLAADERGTVLGAVLGRHPEAQGVGEGGLRSGVVHRLDVDTSGVLLVATEEAAWQRLRAAFREHRVEKVYRALVAGHLQEEGGLRTRLALARHRPARVRVLPDDERQRARSGREVAMSWRPLEHLDGATLVEVRPVTGFLHQIRVVLAHLGFPLLGDRTYAPPAVAAAAPRHLLHASRLRLEAGLRLDEVEAASPDPPDFAAAVAARREAPPAAPGLPVPSKG